MSSDSEFVFESSNLRNNSYSFFEDMRSKGKLCDITFKVGDHSILAHSIILAAGIPYFRDAVYDDSATGRVEKEIEIPEIENYAFEALIEFVYCCKITITVENVKDLLLAACALHVDEVRDACCRYLGDWLRPETAFDTLHCAHNLGCSNLVETTNRYIRKKFDEVSRTEGFLNLCYSDLTELIGRDDLHVSKEEMVFEAVLHWVQKSPLERGTQLAELLKNVRMTLLDPRYLSDYVGRQELIRTSIPCRDLLDEAKNYHLFPETRHELFTFCTVPRSFEDKDVNCIPVRLNDTECGLPTPKSSDHVDENKENEREGILKGKIEIQLSSQCFNYKEKAWNVCSVTPLLVDGPAIEVDGKVYVFNWAFTLEYDPGRNKISLYSGSDRDFTGVAILDDEVYVCGGELNGTNTVEMFNTETKQWTEIPSMLSQRRSAGVVALEGCIYVLGGRNSNIFRGMEKYDAEWECWSIEMPMLTRRYSFGCAVLNGKIYVCGGQSINGYLNTAEVYDSKRRQWKFISSMIAARSKFTLLPYRGKLYAIGGEDDCGGGSNTVQIYNPETDEWMFEPYMESCNAISFAVVVSGKKRKRNAVRIQRQFERENSRIQLQRQFERNVALAATFFSL